MASVRLQVMAWLSSPGGPQGSRPLVLEEEIGEAESMQTLLNRLARLYPVFREHIFDVEAQELTGRVTVIYNGRLLELAEGLSTRLKDGDRLIFLPAFAGGGQAEEGRESGYGGLYGMEAEPSGGGGQGPG